MDPPEEEAFIDDGAAPDTNHVVLTPQEILTKGLQLLGYKNRQIRRFKPERATTRFKSHYGAKPIVLAKIWEDLQKTTIEEAQLDPRKKNRSIEDFLRALHFLRAYDTEARRESRWQVSDRKLRDTAWYYIGKLQALKGDKIVWRDGKESDVWIMTVDGTSCAIDEPTHPEFSQNQKAFSHKKKHAGLTYELGISLFTSHLVWMNGPFLSGANDKTNLVKHGLKQKLKSIGKKALGDKIYNGHANEVSTFNAFDDEDVKAFKSRAQMRHEKFNGMLKEYGVLKQQFRHHSIEKFAMCFEAVSVICQYRMEHGEPLYELLAGI